MQSKSRKMTNRELSNLILIVLISIAFSLFAMSVHFFHKMFEYFYPYMKMPIVEFIFGITFFWLTCFIWITYRYWKKAEENLKELRTLSPRDQLTSLYDRRGFLVLAEHYMKIAKQQKKEIMFLYMDIKGLKWINDNFGHFGGDQLLNDTAHLLRETFRETDILARIGGDEFVALLFGVSQDIAEEPLKRFRRHIEEFNVQKTYTYKLEITTGIVFYDYKCPLSVEELLQKADRLIYEEKRKESESFSKAQYNLEEPLVVGSY
jgi:diguanylate cyclase (GGDEF)-like protein